MNSNQILREDDHVIIPPVFDGLEALGFRGLDIAETACVSPSTISKWRNGYVLTPNEFKIFLTLVLASRLLDALDENNYYKETSRVCSRHKLANLQSARENLEAQEKISYNLPSSAIRSGAIRFRYWWHTQQRLNITEMQMSAGQPNKFLAAY